MLRPRSWTRTDAGCWRRRRVGAGAKARNGEAHLWLCTDLQGCPQIKLACTYGRGEHRTSKWVVVQLLQPGQRVLHAQLVGCAGCAGVAAQVDAGHALALAPQRLLHLLQALYSVVVGPQVGELRSTAPAWRGRGVTTRRGPSSRRQGSKQRHNWVGSSAALCLTCSVPSPSKSCNLLFATSSIFRLTSVSRPSSCSMPLWLHTQACRLDHQA